MNSQFFSYYEKPADFKQRESKLSDQQVKEEEKDDYRMYVYDKQNQYNFVVDEEETTQIWYFKYLTDEKCKSILENDASLDDGTFLINKEYDLHILYILYRFY
jgi:hypothetical protein